MGRCHSQDDIFIVLLCHPQCEIHLPEQTSAIF